MMKPIFSMERGFKAMFMRSIVAYWFNTILMYKFRHSSNLNHLIHNEVVLTITPLEWLVLILPDVVPGTQNRTLKKQKLDPNPRYSPDYMQIFH